MENNKKRHSKILVLLILIFSLIFITVLDLCFVKIAYSNIQKFTLNLDSFQAPSINLSGTLKANLYQAPIITEPQYSSNQCANIFLNKKAMVIGDSTAEGLVAYGALYDSNVIWTRGRTIQYMTADLQEAINYQPEHLFLSYGANDLLSWCGNVDGYINAYKESIAYIRSVLPNTKLYINGILPVDDSAIARNENFKYEALFNEHLHQFCLDNKITFIDNRNLLNQNDGKRVFESDGVHPRPFFYNLWVNNMIEVSKING